MPCGQKGGRNRALDSRTNDFTVRAETVSQTKMRVRVRCLIPQETTMPFTMEVEKVRIIDWLALWFHVEYASCPKMFALSAQLSMGRSVCGLA